MNIKEELRKEFQHSDKESIFMAIFISTLVGGGILALAITMLVQVPTLFITLVAGGYAIKKLVDWVYNIAHEEVK